ncbi:MAG: DUF5686 family protein [Chryseotalea sp.]|nr:DUF5686 and carboxypeptidase regulatory-like domain-containing protein [Flammeovirgaceae bacterium]
MRNLLFIIGIPILLSYQTFAQTTTVKGKVTDAATGDPIPFVNVLYKGTNIGTTTDFDGNFTLSTANPTDSLLATYIGYKSKSKKIVKGISQTINFQLEEEITNLQEVVVLAGENPAFEVLRNVVRNKEKNDKRKLLAYEYDTYTKIEVDVDNMSEKFRNNRFMKKITQVLDSVDRIAGEDGKPILPLFITESVSKLYFRDKPNLKYENILHAKVNGVGVEDGTTVTQLVGSSFQEYNFYQNWLNILDKEFVSPIADGWRLYYDYDLIDSLYVGDHYCYRLDFFPRSPQDLAFTGSMWIDKNTFALKQIDVNVGKQANLNFIEKIRIQQELSPTESGAWLPIKNRVLVDVSELSNNSAGMLAKFYTSNKNFVINKPYPTKFYERPIVMDERARLNDKEEKFWDSLRHEPLTGTEVSVYKMIDTLKNIPVIKTYTDIVKIIVDGYIKDGKIEYGPYLGFVSYNNIEGWRIQPGFKTNYKFNKKWIFGGQLGYGFKDEKFKYSAFATHILSTKRWTTLNMRVRRDLGRVGFDDEAAGDNVILLASQRWGTFRRGFYFDESRISFSREYFKGFTQKISIKHTTFDPVFDFGYLANPSDIANSDTLRRYSNAEIILEARYARDELFLQNDNERISLGTSRWPTITVRYTRGIRNVAGTDFSYNKLRLGFEKKIRMGILGVGNMNVNGEYIFEPLPYTLLGLHLGNQTPIFTPITYNLMDYGEFVSDRYITMQYNHHFEGLFFNRIPLLRKLKWRLVGTANLIYGSMSTGSRRLLVDSDNPETSIAENPYFTRSKPYVEIGYGIENIFKFFRVDFIHRLSYLDHTPDVRKFGVFGSIQLSL